MSGDPIVTVYTDTKGYALCSSCKAPIEWYETMNGKKMPVNRGAVYLRTGTDVVGDPTADIASSDTHWATCPDAAKWKRKK